MASGHTLEVRLESGTIKTDFSYARGAQDMQRFKTEILITYDKSHTNLSLHSHPAIDINPIVKVIATGPNQRHCSTTFYQ